MTEPEAAAVENARQILRPLEERARTVGVLLHQLLTRHDVNEGVIHANCYDPAAEPYMVIETIATENGQVQHQRPAYQDDGEATHEGKPCRSYRQDQDRNLAGIRELTENTDREVLKRAERMIEDGEFDPEKSPNGAG